MVAPITLLTDFGLRDGYVAAMKGVILAIAPKTKLIDITHQIPPQDLLTARFQLLNTLPYFPHGTVHVAVVDPGVGSRRRGVAIAFEDGYLVGPDNGIFSGVLERFPAIAAVELTSERFWRSPKPSSTFHGRDIFAPVGAHLASGLPLGSLGDAIAPESLVQLPEFISQGGDNDHKGAGDELSGFVQAIDGFGNIISTIPAAVVHSLVSQGKRWYVEIGELHIPSGTTYSDVAAGELVAFVGSHNWVEVAMNGGNGAISNRIQVGNTVKILC